MLICFTILGDKTIDKSFEFKDPQSSEFDDNTFINKLYIQLSKKIGVDRNHIESSLNDTDLFKIVVREAYKFIEEKNITHYISAIYLGSAKYCICSSTEEDLQAGISAGQGSTVSTTHFTGVINLAQPFNFVDSLKYIANDLYLRKNSAAMFLKSFDCNSSLPLTQPYHSNFVTTPLQVQEPLQVEV